MSSIPDLDWTAESVYQDSPSSNTQQQIGCVRCDVDDPAPAKVYLMNGMSMCYVHAHAQDFTNTHGDHE